MDGISIFLRENFWMRGLITLAVVGAALAALQVGTGAVVSTAGAQTPGFCQAMNSRYAAAVNQAIRKRCRVTTAIPGAMYYARCLRNNPGVTRRNVQRWEQYARTCRGQGAQGGNLRSYCRNVSSAIVNEVRRARNKGCNTSAAWSYGRYFNWCLGAGRQAASRQLNQWARYARTCRGQARPDRRIFCQVQAQTIIRAVNTARNRGCNVRTAWTYNRYYNWCLRSNNAAVNNQRRRWQNYARTCRGGPAACPRIYRPVCGVVNGVRRTYSNSCVARQAGARIIAQGQCQVGGNQRQFCQAQSSRYINAVNRARAKRCNVGNAVSRGAYFNACLRQNRNTTINLTNRWIRYAQTCRGAQVQCPAIYRPVCGIRNGRRQTYSNACVARRAGARIVAQGQCRAGGGQPGGNRRVQCNAYANTALAQGLRARNSGCVLGGATWSQNRSVHFNYCMSVGPGAAAALTRRRAQTVADCGRN